MKESLLKRLPGYSAFVAVTAFAPEADAQVLYTDINPDFVNVEGTYSIDLNNDGINEFNIKIDLDYSIFFTYWGHQTTSFSHYFLLVGNPDNRIAVNQYKKGRFLNAGSNIGPYLDFSNDLKGALLRNDLTGEWSDGQDGFAGLRITYGGNDYYGWVRLMVETNGDWSATIRDYAINLTPNKAILAGQGSELLNSVPAGASEQELLFNVEGKHLRLFRIPPELSGGELTVIDITGKIISRDVISGDNYKKDLSAFAGGLYFFEIKKGGPTVRKKVLLP